MAQVEELQRVREQLESQVEALARQMRALDDENARLRVRCPPHQNPSRPCHLLTLGCSACVCTVFSISTRLGRGRLPAHAAPTSPNNSLMPPRYLTLHSSASGCTFFAACTCEVMTALQCACHVPRYQPPKLPEMLA